MRTLLSKRDQRQLEFLELLTDKEYITLKEVSQLIGYPIRTLSSDINQINSYLAPAKINTDNMGIYLTIPVYSSVRDIYSLVLKQSREYQLLIYLLFNQGKNYEDIAYDLYISTSTFKRMVSSMNNELKNRNIYIKSGPFRVEGDERSISQLYIALFAEIYGSRQEEMEFEEREILLEICKKMIEYGHFETNYPDMSKLLLWIYIRLLRIKQGYHIKYNIVKNRSIKPDFLGDNIFCNRFYSIFGINITPHIVEEMFNLFLSPSYVKTVEGIEGVIKISSYHYILHRKIKELLIEVSRQLDISLDNTEKLEVDLFNIIQFADNPPYILYSKSKIFVREFCRSNGVIAKTIMDRIKDVFHFDLSEDAIEEILYLLVTHWPSLLERITDSAPKIKIGIFFDSDIEHAEMISDLIQQYSKVKIQVLVSRLKDENDDTIDILITNIPNIEFESDEIICIHEYPTSQDIRNIILAEERIYQKKISLRKKDKDIKK